MTWSPLASGILSGKYEDGIPANSRASLKVKKNEIKNFFFLAPKKSDFSFLINSFRVAIG
jgi:aryl-alcohol dehydrogenase-like predicted oxidoreductase